MRYRFEDVVGWPAAEVAAVPRDRVQRLCAYLPAVDRIEELERIASGDHIELRRRWTLDPSVLPPGLRGIVPDDAVGFEDHLVFESDTVARFTIRPLVHAEALVCDGRLELHDGGVETTLEIEAQLSITAAGAARLPPAIRNRGVPALESALVAAIRAQLRMACRAIEALLDDECG